MSKLGLLLVFFVFHLFSLNTFANITLDLPPSDESKQMLRNSERVVEFNFNNVALNTIELDGKEYLTVNGDKNSLTKVKGWPRVPFKTMLLWARPHDIKVEVARSGMLESELTMAVSSGEGCRCQDDSSDAMYEVGNLKNVEMPDYEIEYLGDDKGMPVSRVIFYAFKAKNDKMLFFSHSSFKVIGGKNIQKRNLGKKHYFVLAPKQYQDEMQPLLNYRKSQGYETHFLNVDDVSPLNENNLQVFIKNSLRQYQQDDVFFVIVGSEKTIPMFKLKTRFDPMTPSDLPYFTFGGTDDYIPDVKYGRFPALNEDDVKVLVAKTLFYESKSLKNGRYLGIASNEGSNPSDWEYVHQMEKPFKEKFGTTSVMLHQNDSNSNPNNISSVIDAGLMWVNYIGHGSGTSWPSINRGQYTVQDLLGLVGGNDLPVVVDVACQNGRFNDEGRFGQNFVLHSSNQDLAGAAAYVGGTVDISWDPPAIMAVGMNQSLASKEQSRLFETYMDGQNHLIKNHSNIEEIKDNFVWFHIQGDPALTVGMH